MKLQIRLLSSLGIFLFISCSFSQTNLALANNGAVATSNAIPFTNSSSTFEVTNANDGNNSRWIVNYVDNDFPGSLSTIYLEIDLGSSYTIDGFKSIEQGDNMKDFLFKTWNGFTWDIAISETNFPSHSNEETNFGTTTYTIQKKFNPVSTTKVRLEITAHNKATDIRFFEFEVYEASTVGLDDVAKNRFNVYPNPVTGDILTINSVQQISSVDIHNIMGIKMQFANHGKNVDVTTLKPGIYFIKVNDTHSIKFIKQ